MAETNLSIGKKETHGPADQTCGCQGGGGGSGMDWGFGVSRCTPIAFGVDKQCDPAVQGRELYPVTSDGM